MSPAELALVREPVTAALATAATTSVPRLLSVDRFAELITMSPRWVRAKLATGEIRSIQLGRSRRIPVAEVERILSEGV